MGVVDAHAAVGGAAAARPWRTGAVDAYHRGALDADESRTILAATFAGVAVVVGVEPFGTVVDAFGGKVALGGAVVAPGVLGAVFGGAGHAVGAGKASVFVVEDDHHALLVGNEEVGFAVVEEAVGVVHALAGDGVDYALAVFLAVARLGDEAIDLFYGRQVVAQNRRG